MIGYVNKLIIKQDFFYNFSNTANITNKKNKFSTYTLK